MSPRWIKFKVVPGWQHSWVPTRVFGLEDRPNVPHLKPGIRLNQQTGEPAITEDNRTELAGVWLPDQQVIRILEFVLTDDPHYGYQVTNWRHIEGAPRSLDQPINTAYCGDMKEAFDHFIEDLPLTVGRPQNFMQEHQVPVPKAAKPEGYGRWA